MRQLDELILEVKTIIKAYDSIPDIINLPMYHPVSLPAVAFDRLKNKLLNYEGATVSYECMCAEINARNCPVHGVK